MAHKLYKFSLLLDENLPPRSSFPRLNGRYHVKHVIHDFCHKLPLKPISDDEVMNLGVKTSSIIVTINKKDFLKFDLTKNSGIIGISPNLSSDQIDIRTTSFLSKSNKNQIYGHIHYVTQKSIERLK